MNAPHSVPQEGQEGRGGIVAWFARNPVAANLMMVLIIASGLYSLFKLDRTLMPDFEVDWVRVTVYYPGATPAEAEEGVTLKVEEALRNIVGVSHVSAYSFESHSQVNAKVERGYKLQDVRNDVKAAVDQIATLPRETEPPAVSKIELFNDVIQLEIWGDLDPASLKRLATEVKNDMLALPDIASVKTYGMREYQISIEVPSLTLRKYGLTLGDIAQKIRDSSFNLPGGTIRTQGGQVSIRSVGQRYRHLDFASIPLLNRPDGTRLLLGDIATIDDGFVDIQTLTRFNGKPSIGVVPLAQRGQDMIDIADSVREYAAEKRGQLPQGVNLTLWADTSYYLNGRISLMLRNLLLGALLVMGVLILFIDVKLAFWVMLGIPISFLGAIAIAPIQPIGVTANLVSLFALILVLGVVVDDAIIVGESAASMSEQQGHSVNSVIRGVYRVLLPATFGVLTTIVAFSPTLLVGGAYADMPNEIGYVVTLCLLFSLVESKWILPAHLAHTRPSRSRALAPLRALQKTCNHLLKERVIENFYRPLVARAVERRYLSIAIFSAALILSLALVASGTVRFVVIPTTPSDFLLGNLTMNEGVPQQATLDNLIQMEDALRQLDEEYEREHGEGFLRHLNVWSVDGLNGYVFAELRRDMRHPPDFYELVRQWRERVPYFPGTRLLSFGDAAAALSNGDLSLRVASRNREDAEQVTAQLKERLARFSGVHSINHDLKNERDELHVRVKPEAEALGLSQQEISRQIRNAFYGAEAQRIQRDEEEIRVLVSYPREERKSLASLYDMMLRTPSGAEVPLSSAAEVSMRPASGRLSRIDGVPAYNISAFVDQELGSPTTIVSQLMNVHAPEILEKFPSVKVRLNEASQDQSDMIAFLAAGFVFSMLANYALLAVPLKSYAQPLIIMSVIPFGMVGAVIGHMIMGITMSAISIFGIIALSGVVINDSLIMVDFTNREIAAGVSKRQAVINAGAMRYRAIMLTSLTTFFGLLPMLLETDEHARAVLPMAVSLGFGIIFATLITLLLVPCLYMALDDITVFTSRLRGRQTARAGSPQAPN